MGKLVAPLREKTQLKVERDRLYRVIEEAMREIRGDKPLEERAHQVAQKAESMRAKK